MGNFKNYFAFLSFWGKITKNEYPNYKKEGLHYSTISAQNTNGT